MNKNDLNIVVLSHRYLIVVLFALFLGETRSPQEDRTATQKHDRRRNGFPPSMEPGQSYSSLRAMTAVVVFVN